MNRNLALLALPAAFLAAGALPAFAEGGAHGGDYFAEHGGLVRVLVAQAIGFILLFLALKKWVLPVLGRMLQARADGIRDTYAKLDREKEELARLTKAAQDRLAGLEKETQERIAAAVAEGSAQKKAILDEAGAAAARILAKAKAEIEVERAKAVEEIRQEMVRLSLEAAERLVRQQLTASKQEELVERFIAEIEKVRA